MRIRNNFPACLIGVMALVLGTSPVFGQTQGPNRSLAGNAAFVNLNQTEKNSGWPPSGPAPRSADAKPDLSGAWAPNAIRQNVDLLSTGVEIPFQPWAEKIYNERKASNSKDDPEARCMPPGVPRMSTTPYPFRIMQTPSLILIVYEGGAHVWRQIFMDGRPHPKDINPSWLGDSIGHWEGDTLVIDTVGFNGKSWIDESGLPTTEDMHVTERIRRLDLGHLEIEHTVDDSKAYKHPWKFTTHPEMLQGELMEYICQENERDVHHLVGK
ncbi:MAG: hypothetical protein C5B51_06855 [Terriglobia bacterium]|nr:MAG: hypothetical protein C5B51_06855 [Terriglobia bacterium]